MNKKKWTNDNIINPCKDNIQNKCFQNKVALAQSANLNKDAKMLEWCKSHQDHCNFQLKNYCKNTDNTSTPFCQSWCTKNPGECDNAMIEFCKIDTNKNNELCSCNKVIDQNLITKFDKMNPICFNKDCLDKGYKNKDFKVNCDKCLDNVNFKESNIDKLITNIQESCNLIPKTDSQIIWEKYGTMIIIAIIVICVLSSSISIYINYR